MDLTSLPGKFKVGSDASPLHCELRFPSPLPSRVQGVPSGERRRERVPGGGGGHALPGGPRYGAELTLPSGQQSSVPMCKVHLGRRHLCGEGRAWGGGSVRESVSKHIWGSFCVSPGWGLESKEDRPVWP